MHRGDVLSFNVSVSDPEIALGQVMQITWTSNVSGWRRTMTSTMGFQFSTTDLPVGTHRITVTVDDGAANATAWVDVVVKEKEAKPKGFLGDTAGTVAASAAIVILFAASVRRRRT